QRTMSHVRPWCFAGKRILSEATAELTVAFCNLVGKAAFGFNTKEADMSSKIASAPAGQEATRKHCAYCRGKFGMVRHRRAFKVFWMAELHGPSQGWVWGGCCQAQGWLDCLWSASLNVTPYATERSSG